MQILLLQIDQIDLRCDGLEIHTLYVGIIAGGVNNKK